MKRNTMAGFGAVALAAAAMACADGGRAPVAPDGPVARPPAAALEKRSARQVKVDGLRWRHQLKEDLSASAVIGPAGGVLALPATGVRLVVPPGAVARPTTFGVTALAGKLVAYDFEPAGSTFPVALRVEQDAAFIDTKRAPTTAVIAGYFPSRANLDQALGTGSVTEVIATSWSSSTLTFPVWHFSGYIISWGRDGDPSGDDPAGGGSGFGG